MQKYLKGFNPIAERIITARFYSRLRNITVFPCYAPMDTSDDTAKDALYCQLEVVLSKTPKGDIVIILCDFNAKIGRQWSANHKGTSLFENKQKQQRRAPY